MLEAPKRFNTSALISFLPRQIMLDNYSSIVNHEKQEKKKKNKKEKKEKSSSETLEKGPEDKTLDLDRADVGSFPNKGKGNGILIRSIADYLERNGFSKTLSMFQSEAQLEVDGCRTSLLNLEDIFYKVLNLSKDHAEASIDWSQDQEIADTENGGIATKDAGENIHDASEEYTLKKKRKKSNGIDDSMKVESNKPGREIGSAECVDTEKLPNKPVDGLHVKSKEKKKKRSTSEDCSAGNHEGVGVKNLEELKTSGEKTDFKKLQSVVEDSNVAIKDKKRKKEFIPDFVGENNEKAQLAASCETAGDTDNENQLPKSHVSDEDKKKKHKLISDPCDDNVEHIAEFQETAKEKSKEVNSLIDTSSALLAEPNVKHKDKKSKKTKVTSDSLGGNVEQLELDTVKEVSKEKFKDLKSLGCESNTDSKLLDSVTKHASVENSFDKTHSKNKDKKKKRDISTSESLQAVKSAKLDGGISHDGSKEYSLKVEIKEDLEKSDDKKENIPLSEENVDNVKKKSSKKRKRLTSEERESQIDNETVTKESKQTKLEGSKEKKEMATPQKADESLTDNGFLNHGKKRKTEKNKENSSNIHKTTPSEQLDAFTEHKENHSACDSRKEVDGHQPVNGNLLKNEKGGSSSKAMPNKHTYSAEPKTVNAFQRVKADEVKFVDERLQDNSYWAKGGADSGYGAKAQEVLGQVRGRDFRHEKTKKKRGSYRGGQIDLQSHSIKFNYSDDED